MAVCVQWPPNRDGTSPKEELAARLRLTIWFELKTSKELDEAEGYDVVRVQQESPAVMVS